MTMVEAADEITRLRKRVARLADAAEFFRSAAGLWLCSLMCTCPRCRAFRTGCPGRPLAAPPRDGNGRGCPVP